MRAPNQIVRLPKSRWNIYATARCHCVEVNGSRDVVRGAQDCVVAPRLKNRGSETSKNPPRITIPCSHVSREIAVAFVRTRVQSRLPTPSVHCCFSGFPYSVS